MNKLAHILLIISYCSALVVFGRGAFGGDTTYVALGAGLFVTSMVAHLLILVEGLTRQNKEPAAACAGECPGPTVELRLLPNSGKPLMALYVNGDPIQARHAEAFAQICSLGDDLAYALDCELGFADDAAFRAFNIALGAPRSQPVRA